VLAFISKVSANEDQVVFHPILYVSVPISHYVPEFDYFVLSFLPISIPSVNSSQIFDIT